MVAVSLASDSAWLGEFRRLGPEKAGRWLRVVGPVGLSSPGEHAHALGDGHQRFCLSDAFAAKVISLAQGPRSALSAGADAARSRRGRRNPGEIRPFADVLLEHGVPMVKITGQGRQGEQAWATYTSPLAPGTGRTEFGAIRALAESQMGDHGRPNQRPAAPRDRTTAGRRDHVLFQSDRPPAAHREYGTRRIGR